MASKYSALKDFLYITGSIILIIFLVVANEYLDFYRFQCYLDHAR